MGRAARDAGGLQRRRPIGPEHDRPCCGQQRRGGEQPGLPVDDSTRSHDEHVDEHHPTDTDFDLDDNDHVDHRSAGA